MEISISIWYFLNLFQIVFRLNQRIEFTSTWNIQRLYRYRRYGNNFEIYFEEDDFDSFVDNLKNYDIEYIHPVKEHSWGQRVVRLYDSDKHIIEVGENKKMVCRRFWNSGMTPEKVAVRMDIPVEFVKACMKWL